jgi:hypothetical protein
MASSSRAEEPTVSEILLSVAAEALASALLALLVAALRRAVAAATRA